VAESINVIGGDFLVHPVMMAACITQSHYQVTDESTKSMRPSDTTPCA
jgi:hypothetical protein